MTEHKYEHLLDVPPDQFAKLPEKIFMRLWNDKKFLHTYLKKWDVSAEHCTAEVPDMQFLREYVAKSG